VLGAGALRWLEAPEGVLAFVRDPGFTFAANLASVPQPLPPHTEVLLASGPLVTDGTGGVSLPRDTAVWLAG